MSESSQPLAVLPRRTFGTGVPTNFGWENLSKFGRACAVLWPGEKWDMLISQRAGCSERAARQYIKGERWPSIDALRVIEDELRGKSRD